MAIVPMQKVAVLAHHSLREDVIQLLHERGVMEIVQRESDVAIDHTEENYKRAEVQFAIQTLKDFASKDATAAAQKRTNPDEIARATKHTDVRAIVDTLHALEEADTQAERELQDTQKTIDMLSPWTPLKRDLHAPFESKSSVLVLGSIPTESIPAFKDSLRSKAPLADIVEVSNNGTYSYIAATVWRKEHRAFEECATTHGWTAMQLPPLQGTAAQLHEEAVSRAKTLQLEHEKRQKERSKLAAELPNLVHIDMYMQWLEDRQQVRESMSATKNTIALLGWIPAKDVKTLEKSLHDLSPATAVMRVKPDEGEEAPILLRHPKIIAPFVSVTSLYGLPLAKDVDPTMPLSPFFILFFALCLTDAGYGLVLFTIFSIVLLKTKKSVYEAPLLWLLWMSGIMTILVGIPFGGWFGLTPDQVPAALTRTAADGSLLFKGQIWNLSQQSGVDFLQYLSLALGLTHLMFGMFIAGWHKWVHGQKAAAFWQDFTSHILFAAIGFYIAAPLFPATASFAQYAFYILIAAIVLAIWGKGHGSPWYVRPIMGLIGMLNLGIAMLSNGLSYLRILALGLVTGAMALAVNQVAIEMSKLFPIFIAIPVIVIIFTGGHLVSIALNTLGSFIHSGRLQFIEFFSQFFEGGGRPFSPFRR